MSKMDYFSKFKYFQETAQIGWKSNFVQNIDERCNDSVTLICKQKGM